MALEVVINQVKDEIEKVTEALYQQKERAAYNLLNMALPTIAKAVEEIFAWQTEQGREESEKQEIVQVLTQAMQAMEQKDTVLLADILQYELLERFNAILEQ